ncbi:Fe-S cluster assembly ATPase SufC [Candidatus Woesearchaeota archaeon]|nr:Fe-S cluster assembly ATPase SufC [Candidatus Woesearchaeota archaeon]
MKLKVENITAEVEGKEIIKNINLEVNQGEVVALMGPNGSGKTTLSNVLMGNKNYELKKGKIILDDKDITNLTTDKRAKEGLFLSFQHPPEISGVTISSFIRSAVNSRRENKLSVIDFKKILKENMDFLGIDESFAKRYLNEGFSGGEKKKMEILQLLMLKPKIAILDEADSGTDIDALKIIAKGINKARENGTGILIITHYQRILNYVHTDKVNVLINGEIKKTGGKELVDQLEKEGYKLI